MLSLLMALVMMDIVKNILLVQSVLLEQQRMSMGQQSVVIARLDIINKTLDKHRHTYEMFITVMHLLVRCLRPWNILFVVCCKTMLYVCILFTYKFTI